MSGLVCVRGRACHDRPGYVTEAAQIRPCIYRVLVHPSDL